MNSQLGLPRLGAPATGGFGGATRHNHSNGLRAFEGWRRAREIQILSSADPTGDSSRAEPSWAEGSGASSERAPLGGRAKVTPTGAYKVPCLRDTRRRLRRRPVARHEESQASSARGARANANQVDDCRRATLGRGGNSNLADSHAAGRRRLADSPASRPTSAQPSRLSPALDDFRPTRSGCHSGGSPISRPASRARRATQYN